MVRPRLLPWRGLGPCRHAARCITMTAANPSSQAATPPRAGVDASTAPLASPDAQFQVIGTPFSLLSVSLSASQTLYTRRGTLVTLTGKAENTLSTLSFLEPFRRAPLAIPFLYQKISSTSPITALISTKSPISSIVSVNIDGRQDWVISQRQALLAWTGHTLNLTPQYNIKLGITHWANTYVTGRGLLALVGNGQIYQVQIKAGESYIAHPSNVVAYTATSTPPLPFRFKSSSIRFQVPDLDIGTWFEKVKFLKDVSQSQAWRALSRGYFILKTWLRRTIWGDKLFLRFEGPTTMLLQSRASRISDVLTLKEVNEIAESEPGAIQDAISRKIKEEIRDINRASSPPIASTGLDETILKTETKAGQSESQKPIV